MAEVIEESNKLSTICNFLSEYIVVLAITRLQDKEAKKGSKAEVKKLCGSIIGKVKYIEKLLYEEIGE